MIYWIWLQNALGFASAKLKPLLQYFSTAENVYNADISEIASVVLLTPQEFKRFQNKSLAKADKIFNMCSESGIQIVTYNDTKYPDNLRNIDNPPTCFYVKGKLPAFDNTPTIAMVGTRKADDYSVKAAWSLSARLSLANCLVISGGALGIDSAAHRGALDVGANTVAILACGLNYDYLKQNEDLRTKISRQGCLLSECPPDYPIKRLHFTFVIV